MTGHGVSMYLGDASPDQVLEAAKRIESSGARAELKRLGRDP